VGTPTTTSRRRYICQRGPTALEHSCIASRCADSNGDGDGLSEVAWLAFLFQSLEVGEEERVYELRYLCNLWAMREETHLELGWSGVEWAIFMPMGDDQGTQEEQDDQGKVCHMQVATADDLQDELDLHPPLFQV